MITNRVSSIVKQLDKHMRDIVEGSLVTFSLRSFGLVLGYGFNVMLARRFGAEGAGTYILAFTIVNILSISGRVGLDNTVLRFVSAHHAVGEWKAVMGIYRKSVMITAVFTLFLTIILLLMSSWFANEVFHKPELLTTLRWLALAIMPMAMLALHGELLKGLQRIRESQLVQYVGVRLLALVGLGLLSSKWGVKGAAWIYLGASVIVVVYGRLLWNAATPHWPNLSAEFELNTLLHSSFPLFWVTTINMITNYLAIFVLGIYRSSQDVGVYGAAIRVAILANVTLVAVGSIIAPKFATLYRLKDWQTLERIAQNSIGLVALLTLPILIVVVALAEPIMGTFGTEFVAGAGVLKILTVGQFVSVVTGTVNFLLMMSGHERIRRNIVVGTFFMNVILNLVLIPYFGIFGAAIATALSMIVQNILAIHYTQKVLKVRVLPWTTVNR